MPCIALVQLREIDGAHGVYAVAEIVFATAFGATRIPSWQTIQVVIAQIETTSMCVWLLGKPNVGRKETL